MGILDYFWRCYDCFIVSLSWTPSWSVAYPVPYMNQDLINAIYKKWMYYNKFLKYKTDKNWENKGTL